MVRSLEWENWSTAGQFRDAGQTEFENKYRSFATAAVRVFELTCSEARRVLRALAERENERSVRIIC